jgi:hypothetical protein
MKLTKEQLVGIIKEELSVAEAYGDPEPPPSAAASWRQAMDKLLKFKKKLFDAGQYDLEEELDGIVGEISQAYGRSRA